LRLQLISAADRLTHGNPFLPGLAAYGGASGAM
jgi:hypothetical protein